MLRASSVLADQNDCVTISNLAPLPRWVAWRAEDRKGRVTKVPYSATGSGRAKADDPSTWGTRAQAEATASTLSRPLGGGVGLELGSLDGDHAGLILAGIDLDTCCPEGGAFEPVGRRGDGAVRQLRRDLALRHRRQGVLPGDGARPRPGPAPAEPGWREGVQAAGRDGPSAGHRGVHGRSVFRGHGSARGLDAAADMGGGGGRSALAIAGGRAGAGRCGAGRGG